MKREGGSMNLKHIITFHTRNDKTIYQIFTNFHNSYQAPVAPIGRSDHCSVLWQPHFRVSDFRKVKVHKVTQSVLRAAFIKAMQDFDWTGFRLLSILFMTLRIGLCRLCYKNVLFIFTTFFPV